MAVFGYDTIGGSTASIAANNKRFWKFVAPVGIDQVDAISVYMDRSATGSGYAIDGAIYADSSGSPGALIANSAIQIHSNIARNSPAWYSVNYGTKPTLTPGNTYWIGVLATKAAITYHDAGGTNQQASRADTLPFDDPFGASPTFANNKGSCYLTYTIVPQSTTKNSDARVKTTQSVTKNSDARVLTTQQTSKTSDARVKVTQSLTKTSDATVEAGAQTNEIQKLSDARILTTQSTSKTSDARVKITQSAEKVSDARVLKTQELTKSSDAAVFATVEASRLSDARVLKTGELAVASDARVLLTQSASKTSDARVLTTATLAPTSDARILTTQQLAKLSDAAVFRTMSLEVASDARVQGDVDTFEILKTSDARVLLTQGLSRTSEGRILAAQALEIDSAARVKKTGQLAQVSDAAVKLVGSIEIFSQARVILEGGAWLVKRTLLDGSIVEVPIRYPVVNVQVRTRLTRREISSFRIRNYILSANFHDLQERRRNLTVRLLLEDGSPVNLEGAAAQFILENYDFTQVLSAPAEVLSAAAGAVRYWYRPGDIPKEVRYTAKRKKLGQWLAGHFRVDWPDQTFLEWPLDRRFDVRIH
jgi:hypothetical protein